jgi:hypothetical protein
MKFLTILLLSINIVFSAVIKVEVMPTKLNGKSWDAMDGEPDLYFVINGKKYREQRCQNSFECQIDVPINISYMMIEIWDADLADDDLVAKYTLKVGDVVRNDGCIKKLDIDEVSYASEMLDNI